MANTSVQLVRPMLFHSFSMEVYFCIQKKAFGIIFCYITMTLCFLICTAAHTCYLWFYFSVDWKNKQSQVFLLNHIIIELVLCIEFATETLNVFIFNNHAMSLLNYFIFGLSWTGRPIMQICICIEQYVAVIHPVVFLRYKDIKYKTAVVATVWFISFGCGFIFIYYSNYCYFSMLVFFIAVTVIFFCCVSVLRALKKTGPGDTCTKNHTGKDVGNQQKKNAFNTILSALILILLTYLPQILLFIFNVSHVDKSMLECNIVPIVTSVYVFGVMITPFMNMCKEGHLKCAKYRKEIKETS